MRLLSLIFALVFISALIIYYNKSTLSTDGSSEQTLIEQKQQVLEETRRATEEMQKALDEHNRRMEELEEK